MDSYVELFGQDAVPTSLSDLKPEHVILSGSKCYFIDLETVSVGTPEMLDLISLVNFYSDLQLFVREWQPRILTTYLRHRKFRGNILDGVARLKSLCRMFYESVEKRPSSDLLAIL